MKKKIYFMTRNKAKIATLQEYFKKNNIDVEIEGKDLGIIEPQADSVSEVSKIKALEAYKILKAPVIVEDGGLAIDALKGFPGVYTKYIIDTIAAEAIIKLMAGESNRKCHWVSTVTYINEKGEARQFERMDGDGEIATEKSNAVSEFAWSCLWYIFVVPSLGKVMGEMTKEELYEYNNSTNDNSSISTFISWYKDNWR